MSNPSRASSTHATPSRVATFMLDAPATALAALLGLALGPHAGMLTGAGHTLMRAAANIVLGGNGVGMD